MSNMKDRVAARLAPAEPSLAMVPEAAAPGYAAAMALLPRARIARRRKGEARDLPAVCSFG